MKRPKKTLTADERLVRAIQALDFPSPVYFEVWTRHAITCPADGDENGECQCVPEIFIDTPVGRLTVLPNGSYRPRAILN